MRIRNKKPTKNIFIYTSVVILCLAAAYGVAAWYVKLPPFVDKNVNTGDSVTQQYTNMDRTQSEIDAEQKIKDDPSLKTQNTQSDEPSTPSSDDDGYQTVNVLLTNAGIFKSKVSASGMVTDVSEAGGICTFIFTSGSTNIKKISNSLMNPTSSTCPTVTFDESELTGASSWSVRLEYKSSKSKGVSDTKALST